MNEKVNYVNYNSNSKDYDATDDEYYGDFD